MLDAIDIPICVPIRFLYKLVISCIYYVRTSTLTQMCINSKFCERNVGIAEKYRRETSKISEAHETYLVSCEMLKIIIKALYYCALYNHSTICPSYYMHM